MTKLRDPQEVLETVFGYAAFRGRQVDIVPHMVAGGDAIALLPTGAGKSLCFQVPSICREGTGLVISPLIALMRDQVEALKAAGVRAEALNSTLSADETRAVYRALFAGELELLYVTPERMLTAGFADKLSQVKIAMIAIDEAHCVSSWGHDFRPEYIKLGQLREMFPGVPRIALTATADPQTRADLATRLQLEDAEVFMSSFDRPNISYSIVEKDNARQQLLAFVKRHKGSSGIVYASSRKKVEDIAEFLNKNGIRSLGYHAGMDQGVRARNQDAFLKEEGLTLVATVAFGMGIDKPNVRFVAHADIPGSVEAYYQETGRAGRDGLPSEAWMAYGMQDVVFRSQQIEQSAAAAGIKRIERAKLNGLVGIAETADCRRKAILSHFGEAHAGGCGNCDTCREPVEVWDGTEPARKIMSTIFRTDQRYGGGHLIDVIRGKATDKVKRARHDKLTVFGIGKDIDERGWNSVIRQLVAAGFIRVDHEKHGALVLDESARPILKGEQTVRLRRDRVFKAAAVLKSLKDGAAAKPAGTVVPPEHEELFEALRAQRMTIAREANVPPYVIFHDQTLKEFAVRRPESLGELLGFPGVGEAKRAKYGQQFIDVIRGHDLVAAPAMS